MLEERPVACCTRWTYACSAAAAVHDRRGQGIFGPARWQVSRSCADRALEKFCFRGSFDALAINKQILSQRQELHHESEKGVAHAAMPSEKDA